MNRLLVATLLLAALPGPAMAWEEVGHAAVGVLGVELASPAARAELATFLDSMEPGRIASACNWPDRIRDSGLADWSTPLHYVNPDPAADAWSQPRDCPDGACVPEAVRLYARRLGNRGLSANERKEAFAFLCHFTADLHQPLHVGLAVDRGANDVHVNWAGREMDLHHFWDVHLLASRVSGWPELVELLRRRPNDGAPPWHPSEVDAWTNESLTFMRQFSYPRQRELDPEFVRQSWNVVQQRLDAAATRLAAVLDAVLADAEAGAVTGSVTEAEAGAD